MVCYFPKNEVISLLFRGFFFRFLFSSRSGSLLCRRFRFIPSWLDENSELRLRASWLLSCDLERELNTASIGMSSTSLSETLERPDGSVGTGSMSEACGFGRAAASFEKVTTSFSLEFSSSIGCCFSFSSLNSLIFSSSENKLNTELKSCDGFGTLEFGSFFGISKLGFINS